MFFVRGQHCSIYQTALQHSRQLIKLLVQHFPEVISATLYDVCSFVGGVIRTKCALQTCKHVTKHNTFPKYHIYVSCNEKFGLMALLRNTCLYVEHQYWVATRLSKILCNIHHMYIYKLLKYKIQQKVFSKPRHFGTYNILPSSEGYQMRSLLRLLR
jgi:hypothetical protein